jgi:hypothetical protein
VVLNGRNNLAATGAATPCVAFYAHRQLQYHRAMPLTVFHVDAFTARPFAGNCAAVCPLAAWLDDGLLQAVATENNLSETADFIPRGD